MPGLFRRNKPQSQTSIDPDEVAALLPASVKHPEANRFTPLGTDFDGDEGSDEDIDFLESLVKSVDTHTPAPRRAPESAPAPVSMQTPSMPAVSKLDGLSIFRDMPSDTPERTKLNLNVPDVEMFDLLEDLSTTAAALRRRRAA